MLRKLRWSCLGALIKHHMYGLTEIRLHVFIYWALERGEQSASHIGPFLPSWERVPGTWRWRRLWRRGKPITRAGVRTEFIVHWFRSLVTVRTELYPFLVPFV